MGAITTEIVRNRGGQQIVNKPLVPRTITLLTKTLNRAHGRSVALAAKSHMETPIVGVNSEYMYSRHQRRS